MPKFIKLSNGNEGDEPVFINTDLILNMQIRKVPKFTGMNRQAFLKRTVIEMVGGSTYQIKETPDEIIEMIKGDTEDEGK